MHIPDTAAFSRFVTSLHWMDRPSKVTIGLDLRRELGPLCSQMVQMFVPVCGCLPAGLAFLAVFAFGVASHGLAWPETWTGPLGLFAAAVGAAFVSKLAALVLSLFALRLMARRWRAAAVLAGETS